MACRAYIVKRRVMFDFAVELAWLLVLRCTQLKTIRADESTLQAFHLHLKAKRITDISIMH